MGRRVRIKKIEIKKRDPRIALEKVRRRELYCLSLVSVIVLFLFQF